MGIKDNFSQAVKELWKKDGEDNGENRSDKAARPTELDKYLSEPQQENIQQPQAAQYSAQNPSAAPQQPAQAAQAQTAQQTPPQQKAEAASVQNPAQGGYQFNAAQQNGTSSGVPLETPYYRQPNPQATAQTTTSGAANVGAGGVNGGFAGGGFGNVPPTSPMKSIDTPSDTDEVTVISRNTVIDGNVRSLANMQVDGNIKGNVETTRDIDMSGKVVGDIKCNNASMNSAAMQGNLNLKGKLRMDRDTILIGDLTSQYADVNGRIRGKLEIGGKAELKRDAIVFGDINASTIAVTDGAIIQGYVNTTFLSKEDSRSVFPEAISLDNKAADNKA